MNDLFKILPKEPESFAKNISDWKIHHLFGIKSLNANQYHLRLRKCVYRHSHMDFHLKCHYEVAPLSAALNNSV